jgi:hypothetical protein
MAKQLDPKETIDLKELLMSEVIQSEALINLLDRKGIISKEELLEEIKRVHASMLKAEK